MCVDICMHSVILLQFQSEVQNCEYNHDTMGDHSTLLIQWCRNYAIKQQNDVIITPLSIL